METNQSNRALSLNNTSSGGISNNDDADSTLFDLILGSGDDPINETSSALNTNLQDTNSATQNNAVNPNKTVNEVYIITKPTSDALHHFYTVINSYDKLGYEY